MSPRRALLFLHLAAGAVSGAFLLILALTGSVLVFEPEIDHWLNRRLVAVTPGEHRLSLRELAAAAERRHPGTHLGGIVFHGGDRLAYSLALRGPQGKSVYVNPYTGAELGSSGEANVFMQKVHQFHTNLLLGPKGKIITALAAGFLLFLVLSGVILWARRKIWRWRGSGPRPSFTLHHLAGIYSALFLALFGITGLVIHWDNEAQDYLRRFDSAPLPPQESVHPKPVPGPPLGPDDAYARATAAMPGALPTTIANLGGTTAPIRIVMKYPEDGTPAGRTILLLHPVTGEVLWAQSSRTGPMSMRLAKLWNREIHTGDISGMPTRILACIASLCLALLVVTGPFLFFARHRPRASAVLLLVLLSAATARAADPTRPNMLFAVADDWSFGHAGAYGCRWVKTPGFDRVAREGVLFTHAYTPNAKCAPSRSSILTGRNPWQLKAAVNHVPFFPPEFRTYPEALGLAGYFVGVTMKGWAPGVAVTEAGAPRFLTGKPFNRRKLTPPTSGISANDYAANFQDFLDAAPAGQPWCFWYGCVEPHRPYEYGSGVAKGGKHLAEIDHVPAFWPDDEIVRNDLLDYAYEVEHFDQHLVRMLQLLEERGQLANTIVIVTSDNGMPFPRGKGQDYDYSNHLPLAVMWYQGVAKPGRVVDDYVSFIDFAPTFIEAAGLRWADTGMAPAQGRSLLEILRSSAAGQVVPERDHVILGRERNDVGRPNDEGYPIRGIVKGDLLYLHNFETARWPGGNPETGYLDTDGGATKTDILSAHRLNPADRFWHLDFGKRVADELYDLKQDPDCVRNLAVSDAQHDTMQQLHDQLFRELTEQGDLRVTGQGHIYEEYPYAEERYRHFYERYGKDAPAPNWVSPTDFEKPGTPWLNDD